MIKHGVINVKRYYLDLGRACNGPSQILTSAGLLGAGSCRWRSLKAAIPVGVCFRD